jgi:hypothetical protein
MKTYQEAIKPVLAKYEKEVNKIFADFNKEKQAKKITTTAESNKLWDSKYAKKFDTWKTKSIKHTTKIWNEYHKK